MEASPRCTQGIAHGSQLIGLPYDPRGAMAGKPSSNAHSAATGSLTPCYSQCPDMGSMGRTWEPRGVAHKALLMAHNRSAFHTTLAVLCQANLAQMHTVLRLCSCLPAIANALIWGRWVGHGSLAAWRSVHCSWPTTDWLSIRPSWCYGRQT